MSLDIRALCRQSELSDCVALQQQVWGFEDSHLFPEALLESCRASGGTLIGAWLEGRLVGFALTVPAVLDGELIHHSHMLAVLPGLRNRGIGRALKEAQRGTLSRFVNLITWTFDPLESRNANLNFNKLGVSFGSYYVNFYGEETGSDLHSGIGTDRFLVVWHLNRPAEVFPTGKKQPDANAVIRVGTGFYPKVAEWIDDPAWPGETLKIEVPPDIQLLKSRDPRCASLWRETTRKAFTACLEREYAVAGFHVGQDASGRKVGAYRLEQRVL